MALQIWYRELPPGLRLFIASVLELYSFCIDLNYGIRAKLIIGQTLVFLALGNWPFRELILDFLFKKRMQNQIS